MKSLLPDSKICHLFTRLLTLNQSTREVETIGIYVHMCVYNYRINYTYTYILKD